MATYLLSMHMDPTAAPSGPPPTPEETAAGWERIKQLNNDIRDAGAWVFGGGLMSADSATVVTVRDGERLVTDGPYAETREQLAGFYIVDVDDLDAALEWAARTSDTIGRPIEVRPFNAEADADHR